SFSVFAFVGSNYAFAQVLDDSANRKILKFRSNLLQGDTTQKYSAGQLSTYSTLEEQIRASANCGAVDIGNQDVNSNFSGEINIIIAGDIINSGNNCR
ncbi:MAG: hypothetical protein R3261_08975, partial [Alphaproteobacteria bacterium]|nr:hypothetical protein [Alphaproteobacteria bacterium]